MESPEPKIDKNPVNRQQPGFTLYPAIDLWNGKVVRLRQGDPDQQTTFSDDPAAVAQRWFSEDSHWIHVVNLNGAFSSAANSASAAISAAVDFTGAELTPNLSALQSILEVTKNYSGLVQFGGGLRNLEDIDAVIKMGVHRVVLGTTAIENPEILQSALEHFGPGKIAVALDAKEGEIRIRGWKEGTGISAVELGKDMAASGIRTVIYTNIARDGMGTGADIQASIELADETGLDVIVSGGVKSIEDVRKAKAAGRHGSLNSGRISGIIIGRALYDGTINLEAALQC